METGSTFRWTYDYCFDNDPASKEDLIYNGVIDLAGFTEAIDGTGATPRVTELGFWPDEAGSRPGGVIYNDFMVFVAARRQRELTLPEDRTLDYSGCYSIMFTVGTRQPGRPGGALGPRWP